MPPKRTIILGLGNPLMTDDAVGILVARALHARLADPNAVLREAAVAGIELMELLVGYDRAIIVDAVQTDGGKPGDWFRLAEPTEIDGELPQSSHRFGVFEGLELGRRLELDMPAEIRIYAVEAPDPFTFGEGLSPALAAELPKIVEGIFGELAG